jgi:hypothetical protein
MCSPTLVHANLAARDLARQRLECRRDVLDHLIDECESVLEVGIGVQHGRTALI